MSSTSKFPSWTHKYDIEAHHHEYSKIFSSVINSDRLLFGQHLLTLESQFSKYIGTSFGIGCDNATNGLFLSLKSLGIGSGDEVLTVPNTAIPTVSAIVQSGATPVFCDVNQHGLIDLSSFDISRHPNLKAVIPVHLYGFACDMSSILEFSQAHNLYLIEDCSQAHGSQLNSRRVGSFGDLAVFSFYPTKPLGGLGDAGIVLTNSVELSEKLRRLRFYGIDSDYFAIEHGYNSRVDEIHAAILVNKLSRLEHNISQRRLISEYYISQISNPIVYPLNAPKNCQPSHYLIPFLISHNRDLFQSKLSSLGIGSNVSYRHPIHLMDAYKYLGYSKGDFPVAESLCAQVISFPVFDSFPFDMLPHIVDCINSIAF